MAEFKIDDMSQNTISPPIIETLAPPFWAENPNILFYPQYLFEFFPTTGMTYSQKLNAISRTVILLTLLTFLMKRSWVILVVSAMTLFAIYVLYFYKQQEHRKNDRKTMKEGFESTALDTFEKFINDPDTFDKPTPENPFCNVRNTDIDFNPNKKPAPPSFNENINEQILESAKQMVRNAHPDQPDIGDRLFTDLGDQFVFEQSMRPFYSMPSTTIPNDQTGFAEFCYGNMVSCKEGNRFACNRNLDRHTM